MYFDRKSNVLLRFSYVIVLKNIAISWRGFESYTFPFERLGVAS